MFAKTQLQKTLVLAQHPFGLTQVFAAFAPQAEAAQQRPIAPFFWRPDRSRKSAETSQLSSAAIAICVFDDV